MPGRPLPATPDALIIGAGPAGLALAFELKRRGVESLLLESGAAVAHSWANMPTHLKLVSPWKANHLPGSDSRCFPPNHEMTVAEYCSVLQQYARLNQLPVVTNATVHDVTRRTGDGFVVHTSAGTFNTPLLVNATGCFANPFTPKFLGARESSLPQFHFATFRDAEQLRKTIDKPGGLVLIVGKRLSAGQALVELVDAGFEAALSCRGPIQFGAGPIGWWMFFRIHPALERLKLRLKGTAARGFPPVMPGGRARRLIQNGRVKTFPDIARFENRRVVFTDGCSLQPNAVLYATGFRPALTHLVPLGLKLDERTGQPALRGFESADVPGLFFLGLDGLRNFRSRFIRGIREDAALLAGELAANVWRRKQAGKPAGQQVGVPAFPPAGFPACRPALSTRQS
jgi:cation diffusion facilitator CzcD-associated flavoprotein CzcO